MQKTKELASIQEIEAELQKVDFDLWFAGEKIPPTRLKIQSVLNKKVRPVDFKEARKSCRWWKKIRKRDRSHATCLDFDEWERLRAAVKSVLDQIQGRTLAQAVAIVSSLGGVACNPSTLKGLNSDLRVWVKPIRKSSREH